MSVAVTAEMTGGSVSPGTGAIAAALTRGSAKLSGSLGQGPGSPAAMRAVRTVAGKAPWLS